MATSVAVAVGNVGNKLAAMPIATNMVMVLRFTSGTKQ